MGGPLRLWAMLGWRLEGESCGSHCGCCCCCCGENMEGGRQKDLPASELGGVPAKGDGCESGVIWPLPSLGSPSVIDIGNDLGLR